MSKEKAQKQEPKTVGLEQGAFEFIFNVFDAAIRAPNSNIDVLTANKMALMEIYKKGFEIK